MLDEVRSMTTERRTIGNYTLGALIGRGATSEVYGGTHTLLGDEVALKLLRPELGDEAAIEALVAEAARTRAIVHPNVVQVIDAGRDAATGRGYLVLERVGGDSLHAHLSARGRLDEPTARRLFAGIADGVQAAHAIGIVHCDLKPANVMLDGERPKLVDFGIARSLGGDAAALTQRRVGTPAYMAPEQLAAGLIAPAIDVWALGVMMFEAVTGRLPFEDFAGGRCPQLVEDAPRARALAAISPALDELIARCLAREPGRRPASMADVARALRAEPGDERITQDVGPDVGAHAGCTPAPRPRRSASARGAWVYAIGSVATAGAATAALVLGASDSSGTTTTPPPAATTEPPPSPSPPPSPPPPAEPARRGRRAQQAGRRLDLRRRRAPRRHAGAPGARRARRDRAAPAGYRTARVRAEHAGVVELELVRARRTAGSPRAPSAERARRRETLD